MPDSQPEKKARSLQSSDGWTWKVENRRQNVGLKLLYEPGNWGDVLKGTWALEIAGELTRRARQQPLRFLDPFAGAATYPLTDSAARRLAWLGECEFTRAQGPWTATGRIASTGLLVRAAVTVAGHGIAMDVFDADAERLEAWGDVPEARRLALRSGEEALRDPAADFILVDPYDLFDSWPSILPLAIDAARSAWVLLYLHNRSPRGGGHLRSYEALRRTLDAGDRPARLIGRLAGDVFLPREFHEVILLGAARFPRRLEGSLRRSTAQLAARLAAAGAFEAAGGAEERE